MNEDARITKEGMLWHFQHIIEEGRLFLKQNTERLVSSRDFDGRGHANNVRAIEVEFKKHFGEMEAFIQSKINQEK